MRQIGANALFKAEVAEFKVKRRFPSMEVMIVGEELIAADSCRELKISLFNSVSGDVAAPPKLFFFPAVVINTSANSKGGEMRLEMKIYCLRESFINLPLLAPSLLLSTKQN